MRGQCNELFGSDTTDVAAEQCCSCPLGYWKWYFALFLTSIWHKNSDMFLAPSRMCRVGGHSRIGFCIQQAGPAGLVVFLCLPFKGPLRLPWLPCFFGFLLYNWVLRFHPGFRRPAQSGDYSWAVDGLGVLQGGGALNECHYILMKPIGCSLFVFNFLKSPGAWLKPQNRYKLVWSTHHNER